MYKQILINAKVKPGNRGQETEMTGRSALRRGRSACIGLRCHRRRRKKIKEEEEKTEEKEEEEEKERMRRWRRRRRRRRSIRIRRLDFVCFLCIRYEYMHSKWREKMQWIAY